MACIRSAKEYNMNNEFGAVALTSDSEQSRFLGRTYGWMMLALLISAASAFVTATALASALYGGARVSANQLLLGFGVAAVVEVVLVLWLSASIRRISVQAAAIGFVAYSVVNGITLSTIFFVYDITSIAGAFLATALTFGAMSLYGMRTKRNLNAMGRYLMMGLLGVIVASLVQFVLSRVMGRPLVLIDMLVSVAIVVIFTGLTAYDAQKLLRTAHHAVDTNDYRKVSILAALELYLDFINILLALLRLFGRRRD